MFLLNYNVLPMVMQNIFLVIWEVRHVAVHSDLCGVFKEGYSS